MTTTDKKDQALASALAKIERDFGKGTIMQLGEGAVVKVEPISTRCLTLDRALGVGGIAKGRIAEIYGPESSGKTTICLQLIAEVQSHGGRAAFVDAEHALDPLYAQSLGVNLDELLVSQPDCGEDALEIVDTLARSGALDLIIVDSVAALTPKAELEGAMGDNSVGLQARLMGKALRKLAGVVRQTNTALVFTNQLREKVGVMFGSPETTPGGKALKFYASQRIDIRRIGAVKDGTEIIGNQTKIKIAKNKVAPPFKTGEFDILYGTGVSLEIEIIKLGVENNIIQKSGSFFSYGELRLGQGQENARKFLLDPANAALRAELLEKVRIAAGIDESAVEIEEEDLDQIQSELEQDTASEIV